jgi:hypothetical protein
LVAFLGVFEEGVEVHGFVFGIEAETEEIHGGEFRVLHEPAVSAGAAREREEGEAEKGEAEGFHGDSGEVSKRKR